MDETTAAETTAPVTATDPGSDTAAAQPAQTWYCPGCGRVYLSPGEGSVQHPPLARLRHARCIVDKRTPARNPGETPKIG